jgi:hypothetical protein
MPVIPAMTGNLDKNMVQGCLGQKVRPYLKISIPRGMTQGIQQLPCKHEALNSNTSSTKKKKKSIEDINNSKFINSKI